MQRSDGNSGAMLWPLCRKGVLRVGTLAERESDVCVLEAIV